MNRKEQQAELIYKLGLLLRPLQDLVDYPERQTPQTRARAAAKYAADQQQYIQAVKAFSLGEPGHNYHIEWAKLHDLVYGLSNRLATLRNDTRNLDAAIQDVSRQTIETILTVPVDVEGTVLEASSPFQAYCKLKAIFETAASRIIWADPYMGAGLFHRYLNELPAPVEVTLVTVRRSGKQEYTDFLDVSRLYARERGPTKYRLIVEPANHDRLLWCDDQLYHFGGSAKDAGHRSPFTISKMEPTPENLQTLNNLIATGMELFGPSNATHP